MTGRKTSDFLIVRGTQALPSALARPIVAVGNFDGVHRGHRAVFDAARDMAREAGAPALALTFEPHPRTFFHPEGAPFRLTPADIKLAHIAQSSLDGAIVLAFDAALATMEAEDFVRDVLVARYAIAGAAVGFDFHFGRARAGSPAFLEGAGKRHGFAVRVVPPMRDEGDAISSTAIRKAIAAGQVGHAAHMLGRPFSVSAEVIHGEKRGRLMGFPTANLVLPDDLELAFGIYAVQADTPAGRFDGVASYGRRPTFDNGRALLEVFLFDFSGDLYGTTLEVAFHAYLRPELKFDGMDALVEQIHADARQAREVLARLAHP